MGKLLLGNVDLGQTHRSRVHSGSKRVSLIASLAHDVSGDDQLLFSFTLRVSGVWIEGPTGRLCSGLGSFLGLRLRSVLILSSHLNQSVILLRRSA